MSLYYFSEFNNKFENPETSGQPLGCPSILRNPCTESKYTPDPDEGAGEGAKHSPIFHRLHATQIASDSREGERIKFFIN